MTEFKRSGSTRAVYSVRVERFGTAGREVTLAGQPLESWTPRAVLFALERASGQASASLREAVASARSWVGNRWLGEGLRLGLSVEIFLRSSIHRHGVTTPLAPVRSLWWRSAGEGSPKPNEAGDFLLGSVMVWVLLALAAMAVLVPVPSEGSNHCDRLVQPWTWTKSLFEHEATLINDCSDGQFNKAASADMMDRQGWTALHWAASHSGPELVKKLIEAGAELNSRDAVGATALHRAMLNPNASAVFKTFSECLPKASQSKSAFYGVADARGWTPMHWAASGTSDPTVVSEFVMAGGDLDLRGPSGIPPVFLATTNPVPEVVQSFLSQEPDLYQQDSDGRTVVHWAAAYASQSAVLSEVLDAVEKENGGALERAVNARDFAGATPLHQAIASGNSPSVVNMLLQRGADPNIQDNLGFTVLDYALLLSKLEAVAGLKAAGAQLEKYVIAKK